MLHRYVLDLDVGLGLLDIDNMKKTLIDLSFNLKREVQKRQNRGPLPMTYECDVSTTTSEESVSKVAVLESKESDSDADVCFITKNIPSPVKCFGSPFFGWGEIQVSFF